MKVIGILCLGIWISDGGGDDDGGALLLAFNVLDLSHCSDSELSIARFYYCGNPLVVILQFARNHDTFRFCHHTCVYATWFLSLSQRTPRLTHSSLH